MVLGAAAKKTPPDPGALKFPSQRWCFTGFCWVLGQSASFFCRNLGLPTQAEFHTRLVCHPECLAVVAEGRGRGDRLSSSLPLLLTCPEITHLLPFCCPSACSCKGTTPRKTHLFILLFSKFPVTVKVRNHPSQFPDRPLRRFVGKTTNGLFCAELREACDAASMKEALCCLGLSQSGVGR